MALAGAHLVSVGNLKLQGASMSKAPLGIVPMHPLKGVSRVFEDSDVKYAPGNFMEQACADALAAYDSADLRHRLESMPLSGRVTPESYATLDPDSGLPHIFHRISDLLIIATLMIRDGLIPEDPGMGKRKRASLEPAPVVGTFTQEAKAGTLTTVAFNSAPYPEDIAQLVRSKLEAYSGRASTSVTVFGTRSVDRSHWHAAMIDEEPARVRIVDGTCEIDFYEREVKPDPDAERRAAAEANLVKLQATAQELAMAKERHEWRCLSCNGSGIVASAQEYATEQCNNCKGTGQRTGAEGMKL